MTCIAWDGRMLAADRQATNAGMRRVVSKLRLLPDSLWMTGTGDASILAEMMAWFEAGANVEKFPKRQASDDGGAFLVVRRAEILVYERGPIPLPLHPDNKIAAWGSGRDYAIGAMEMGADAAKAVEIACRWEVYCGHGVDSVVVR